MIRKGISFIIPVYNGASVICNCINSIIKQINRDNVEIIVVDDGSTDGTSELLNEKYGSLPFVNVIHQKNAGVSMARNKGIACAKFSKVYFIDADDKMLDGSMHALMQFVDLDFSVVITGYTRVETTVPVSGEVVRTPSKGILLCALNRYHKEKSFAMQDMFQLWTCWGKLIDRELLIRQKIRFSDRLVLGEDILFMLQCYAAGSCGIVGTKTYYYNPGDDSVSRKFHTKRIVNTLNLAQLYIEWCELYDQEVKQAVYAFIVNITIGTIQKYFYHPNNPITAEEGYTGFVELCSNYYISQAIDGLKYSTIFSLRRNLLKDYRILYQIKHGKYKRVVQNNI